MKKVFLFLAIASSSIFVSCSDDETTPPAPVATAIVLTSDATTIDLGASVTLTVTSDLNEVVTSTSSFFANDIAISGATFTPTTAGTYVLHATNGTLVSNEVTVTVNTVANNSIVLENVAYTTDKSIIYYLGTTAEGLNYFVANPYNEVGDPATYPNDVYILFTSAQTSTTVLDTPTIGAYNLGNETTVNSIYDLNIFIDDTELLADATGATDAVMNMTAFVATDTAQTWAFNYQITLTDNTVIYGEYHGDWDFADLSGGKSSKSVKTNKVTSVSKAQIKANLKKITSKR